MQYNRKAEILIVEVMSNTFEEDRGEALVAGMNGHLAKPYDIPVMTQMIKKLLTP